MRPQQRNTKRPPLKTQRAPKPLFATADPARSATWESRRSVKENAFKKLLVAGNISEATNLLATDPILRVSDLLTKIQRGNSFLHAAITMPKVNSQEFIDLIIEHRQALGATLDERNSEGFAPLHVAIKNSNLQAARSLIYGGAYINIQDKQGNTPLHLAILANNEQAVQALVELGANITIRNKKDFSAQGLAKRHLEELSGKESRPRGRFGRKKRPETFDAPPEPVQPVQAPELIVESPEAGNTNGNWGVSDLSINDGDCHSEHGPGAPTRGWDASQPDVAYPADDDWAASSPADWSMAGGSNAESSGWAADMQSSAASDDLTNIPAIDNHNVNRLNSSLLESVADDFDIFGTVVPPPVSLPGTCDEDDAEAASSSSSYSGSDLDRPEKERKLRRAEKRARKLAQKDEDREARLARQAQKQAKTTSKPEKTTFQAPPATQQAHEIDDHDLGFDLFRSGSDLTASTNTADQSGSLFTSEDSLFHSAQIPATEEEPEPVEPDTPLVIALRILRWLRNHAKVTGKSQKLFLDSIKAGCFASELEISLQTLTWINAVQPQSNESALLCAINYSSADVVYHLISELYAIPRIANLVNESLLHHAVNRGDPRIVSVLLAHDANVFVRNSKGNTPLETALQSPAGANWEIVSALLEATLERPVVAQVQKLTQSICWCLREAVKRGSIDTIRQILASGVVSLASASTGAGWTALHLAVKFGHLEIMELLLKSADAKIINARTSDGFSAVHMAIENAKNQGEDSVDMLNLLLKYGADPNATIKSGISALHMAARHGLFESSAALLRAGAKPDVWNDRLRTPLWLAFKDSRSPICQILVKHGATDLNGKVTYLTGEPLLYESIRRADSDLVRAMIDQKWDFDPLWKHPKTGMTLANLAVMKELDDDVVSVIGKKFLEVTTPKKQQQENDATYSSFSVVAVEENPIPEPSVNANVLGRGPLHTAVMIGSEPMVDLLCSIGFDCNKEDTKGISPISLSLIHQKIHLLRLMAGKYGGLLSFAPVERSRRKPSAQILVELGLDQKDLLQIYLDQKPADAASALWFAIEQNRIDMARWLLFERGTDPNTSFGDLKRTILHRVVQKGDIEAVRLLLSARDAANSSACNVNCQDKHGWTALHIAIQKDHKDIAHLILDDPDVDVSLEDERKFTPLHLGLAVPRMTDVVNKIISLHRNGMRVDLDNSFGKNPLFYALRSRQWEVAAKLLSMSGTVSLSNQDSKIGNSGWSLLHIAAVNGFSDIIHELARGADYRTVNAQEGLGWTPLHLAVRHLHVGAVEALLRYGASVAVATHKLWNPLHTLATIFDVDELKAAGPERLANAEKILNLLLSSADAYSAAMAPNEVKNTPLDLAISFENEYVAKTFLDRGFIRSRSFDFVEFTGLPVHKAVGRRSIATLNILLHKINQLPAEKRFEIMNQTRGRSAWPALFAAVQQHGTPTAMITTLVQNGANVTLCDNNWQNILHLVGNAGSTDAARALRKALPEKILKKLMSGTESQGFTPMDVASGRWIKRYFRKAFLHSYRKTAEDRHLGKPDRTRTRREKAEKRRGWDRQVRFEKDQYMQHRRDYF